MMVMRATFAQDSRDVLMWFDSVAELVGRGDLRQARSQTIDEFCSPPFAVIRTAASIGSNACFRFDVYVGSGLTPACRAVLMMRWCWVDGGHRPNAGT